MSLEFLGGETAHGIYVRCSCSRLLSAFMLPASFEAQKLYRGTQEMSSPLLGSRKGKRQKMRARGHKIALKFEVWCAKFLLQKAPIGEHLIGIALGHADSDLF